jgi:hypothetical protein
MTREYNWRRDFNWQDKTDEPVGEAVFPQLKKVDYNFKPTPTEQVIPLDLESPFSDYLNNVMKVNFKESQ